LAVGTVVSVVGLLQGKSVAKVPRVSYLFTMTHKLTTQSGSVLKVFLVFISSDSLVVLVYMLNNSVSTARVIYRIL